MMIFITNKYYLLILLASFIVGGCGDFSGNYDEIESMDISEFKSRISPNYLELIGKIN